MKKLLTLASVLALSSTAMAGFNGNNQGNQGGFSGGQNAQGTVTTIAQAKNAWDDTPVTLTGYIVNQIDHDEFTFKDETGEIRIDVEDHAWNGLNVTPKDKIVIQGKVDDDWKKSIDVYSIQKAN